jgi:hypothetical protein
MGMLFLIEQDEIDRDEIDLERYFSKIPFRSFELDRISQKLNLTHACSYRNKIPFGAPKPFRFFVEAIKTNQVGSEWSHQ